MFKYGGPIKQGIMHGMRNNYAGGQRVGSGLVGHPAYPKTDGREHHVLPIWAGAAGLARMAPMLYRAITGAKNLSKASNLAKNVSSTGRSLIKVPGGGAGGPGASYNLGTMGGGGGYSGTLLPAVVPQVSRARGAINAVKNWFKKDPLYTTVAGGTTMLGKGIQKAGKGIYAAGKYATTTPSGLLFLGAPVTIAGGKWLLSDGTELNDNQKKQVKQSGVPGGGDPGMFARPKEPEGPSPAELAAEAKADRKARLEKYLDTMGYDKAKKGAIGDALIDASAIVQAGTEEGGSLKHADWGKMINQAIQTTSKRLDKPEQIREAVGLMMTKADIEKDMNKDETALARVLTERRIDVLDKQLKGETLEDSINAAFQKTGNFPTGSTLAGIARTKGLDIESVITAKVITDFFKKNPKSDAMDFMVQNVATAQKEGVAIPPGNYVVQNRIIAVDTEGNLSEVL